MSAPSSASPSAPLNAPSLPATLHQLLAGAAPGDAITDQALLLRRWLREWGTRSDIFALHIHPQLAGEVRPLSQYNPTAKQPWVIYHHSIGSELVDDLLTWPQRVVLIYHNITPPEFFTHVDPAWAARSEQGLAQTAALRPHTALALADSAYNARELAKMGYGATAVLPITLDIAAYDLPSNQALVEMLAERRPLLLFVGRIAPNKRQEDLIKLLYYYRRIQPQAHLLLVGDRWVVGYDKWLESLAADWGLADGVTLMGKVSQVDLVTCYRQADLYISMSEHEGFGKPFIECMRLDLPILAYGAASVPDTLGEAGAQFHHKDFERLAELVDILVTDEALRQRLIAQQRQRLRQFLPESAAEIFRRELTKLAAQANADN
jgi:L-malate glycosyltransferase